MSGDGDRLRAFLAAAPSVALLEVAGAKGSTPREKGAWMLVSSTGILGTIGGGQLEFMAIDEARKLLRPFSPLEGEMAAKRPEGVPSEGTANSTSSTAAATPPPASGRPLPSRGRGNPVMLDIPLGPEIGQCCGGRVDVAISVVDAVKRKALVEMTEAEDSKQPRIYIFGGGHVGHALAASLALLPVRPVIVETRAEALEGMPAGVETKLTPMPEEMVREAPAGAAFVILTHDHALDFLIAAEALKRRDAAYVGMIGSKTKKATFKSWYLKTAGGSDADFARLVSPIGGDAVKDKRPAVIAALASAEITTAVLVRQSASAGAPIS